MLTVLRQALRALGRSPGFTLAALATFAIGIGANATVFGVVNAVLLKAYPYRAPEQLVALSETNRDAKGPGGNGRFPVAPANFRDWQQQATSFAGLAATANGEFTLRGESEPVRLVGTRVTWTLPQVLGVAPQLGRAFTAADDAPGAPPVVMIADALWRTRFGGDPRIAGRVVEINGKPTTIVGVLPPAVRFPESRTELWAPFAMSDSAWSAQRGNHFMSVVARLRPGVTIQAADAELRGIAARIAQAHAEEQRDFSTAVLALHDSVVGNVRPVLLVLMGAVGFVLLIACANVANLTLARGVVRQREVAVRTAMGARPWHLMRAQVAESVLLGVGGAALGLLFASWACAALPAVMPASIPRLDEADVDWRVALFTFGTALVASVAAGLLPALHTSRTDLNGVLKDGNRSSTGGRGSARLRDGLFVAEVAIALLLLTGAGLTVTSLTRLLAVTPGFAPEKVLKADVSLPLARYANDTARAQFWAQALPRLRAIPGAAAAGTVSNLPLSNSTNISMYMIVGRPYASPQDAPLATGYQVSPDYFRTLGVPLRRGRDFAGDDRLGAPLVAIVSEQLVREQFRGQEPIGQQVQPFGPDGPKVTIVGVVGDVRNQSLGEPARPALYMSAAQVATTRATIVLRASGDPAQLAGDVRRAIAGIDPTLAVANVQPMRAVVASSAARPRFSALLLAAFAGCAVLLALVGIYGVMAQSVAQRAGEFSVRVALGARPRDVWRDVIGGALRRAAIGIAIGLAGAAGLTRLLADELYDTSPLDPPVLAAVAVIIALVAALASWVPARRAMRTSPMQVLRTQ